MKLTYIPFDLPGKLYRSPMPFARFDVDNEVFDQFQEEGIGAVVMLIEEGEDLYHAGRDLKALYQDNGMEVIRFPIVDFDTPEDTRQLEETLEQVLEKALHGEHIAVHCFAGRGRTGMFMALLARRILGVGGREAIDYLRRFFPAVETDAQEQLVIDYQPPEED
jgi:protein-tyrosine phosphatase